MACWGSGGENRDMKPIAALGAAHGLEYYSRKSSNHAKILVGFPTAYSL
jgi:hypothetical protein